MNATQLTNDFARYTQTLCNMVESSGYSVLLAAAFGFLFIAAYHCKRTY
jgi:hypothetical protein